MNFSRRSLLAVCAVVPALALAPQPVAAAAALPTVDMEAVLKAAQWDPAKADSAITPGAGPSVKLVETALRKKGYLDPAYEDGHFGSRTITAYALWQRELGYSGLDATGLPGRTSLTKLGDGQFTLTRVLTPGAKTTHQGFPVNARTLAMLQAAQGRSGRTYVVEQGSYSAGTDPTSAGTHDGGGALDLDAEALTAAQRTAAVTALRQVGFAAWLRTPAQGDWPLHIHAIAISDTDLSAPAQKQVGAYYEGRNGLANNAADDGPRVPKVTYEEYLRSL
ncbi:peptidoglycan-binding protein [Actinoplanes sp. NBRC 103695]|uniref:peptidoglycan-binding domain-containing protein n=1 Tax=Actinoplanes sp. NBRC 103695 TaxID=3032202 RepID=UPI0024A22521|nr:peptidoglycan-binding protein [Actinoplanes sp. NBRC 103695]GLY93805.1 peptidoglycan-binding protein [Actinoplanes sp. NBRC 103695]